MSSYSIIFLNLLLFLDKNIRVFLYFLYHFENQSAFYFNSRYRLSVGLRLSRSHDGDGNSPMKTVGGDTDGATG